jgi:pimeloyl-ACP methyl ester carboxylesterase
MTPTRFAALRKVQDTPSGRISYVEQGSGPVALFVHGFPLNGLADTIPGVRKVEILNAARLFFPEERADEFNGLLRAHWLATEPRPASTATMTA